MSYATVDAIIAPEGRLEVLSKAEMAELLDTSQGGLYTTFRNCSLAVLNSGSYLDDGKELLERYRDFRIRLIQEERGIKLELKDAPESAFVDGKLIKGISEHLFAVLRDVIYVSDEIDHNPLFDTSISAGITDAVFHILRNAGILRPVQQPRLVVCWGGHSISRGEYDYTKEVGYQLGLRGLDICTGCGPGAMKGPMKGAAIGHSKQRIHGGQYLGISEPGIIAAESPNPIVNELVIMPDIEKRLEAFVRTGHGVVVFPGGAGTAEEILYILGILLHPDNAEVPFPLVFTGPAEAADYFREIDEFIGTTLGSAAQQRYRIIVNDPVAVARALHAGIKEVRDFRKHRDDAYYFNWLLKIEGSGGPLAGGKPAAGVFRHRGRQRQGRGDSRHRATWPFRDSRRCRHHGATGRTAGFLCRPAADEAAGHGIHTLLQDHQLGNFRLVHVCFHCERSAAISGHEAGWQEAAATRCSSQWPANQGFPGVNAGDPERQGRHGGGPRFRDHRAVTRPGRPGNRDRRGAAGGRAHS